MAFNAWARLASLAEAVVNPANGNTYQMTSRHMSWIEAEAEAVSLGGHLVSITSQAEQDLVVANFLSGSSEREILWIGLNDAAEEGVFRWSDGSPVTYVNWPNFINSSTSFLQEPNNCPCVAGGEDYGVINCWFARFESANRGEWNDVTVNGSLYPALLGIIEIAPAAVPEPGTLALFGIAGLGLASVRRQKRESAAA